MIWRRVSVNNQLKPRRDETRHSRHGSIPLYAIDVVQSTPLVAQLKRPRDNYETLCQYRRESREQDSNPPKEDRYNMSCAPFFQQEVRKLTR